jgi:Rrf2 family iron-sulfur cluster assembly transcriptional regulator
MAKIAFSRRSPQQMHAVLQSLVRGGILKGIRGPHGGYELAREPRGVTANDILRAASTVHEAGEEPNSELVAEVVLPVLSVAEREFGCFCFGFWQSSSGQFNR